MEEVYEGYGPTRAPSVWVGVTAVREFPSTERLLGWKSSKEGNANSVFRHSLRHPSRHVQKAAACVYREACWSQDRNVGFVDI